LYYLVVFVIGLVLGKRVERQEILDKVKHERCSICGRYNDEDGCYAMLHICSACDEEEEYDEDE